MKSGLYCEIRAAYVGCDEHGLDLREAGEKEFHAWRAPAAAAEYRLAGRIQRRIHLGGTLSGHLVQINVRTLQARQSTFSSIARILVDSRDRVWLAVQLPASLFHHRAAPGAFRPPWMTLSERSTLRMSQRTAMGRSGLSPIKIYSGSMVPNGHGSIFRGTKLGRPLFDLKADYSGHLWIDSINGGAVRLNILGVYKLESFERPRLSSDNILFFNCICRNWMWVGEDNGVEMFDGHD